jgi:hypothetical protein
MKKKLLLLATAALFFSGAAFAQTGKNSDKAKKDSTAAAKKPMPKQCPGKTCGKKKVS